MEAILPLDPFYDYMDRKLDSIIRNETIDYDRMTNCFVNALSHLSIAMDSKEVGKLTSSTVDRTISSNNRRLNRLGGKTNV